MAGETVRHHNDQGTPSGPLRALRKMISYILTQLFDAQFIPIALFTHYQFGVLKENSLAECPRTNDDNKYILLPIGNKNNFQVCK